MTPTEAELKARVLREVVPQTTEGLRLRVRKGGRLVCDIHAGRVYRYYDLASLTKIIFTNSALMILMEEGKLKLSERVEEILPWLHHRNITIKSLLTHSAGLTWWKAIYKKTSSLKNVNEKWETLKKILNSEKPRPAGTSVYSDLDYFLLAFVMERKAEKPLLPIWADVEERLGLSGLHFNPQNRPRHPRALYAPTENCPWRGRILKGEVHDDNTWALGGVSSHAGLFGGIDDVDRWFLSLRNSYLGRGPLKAATVKTFWTRALPEGRGDWALGFMMPSENSSAGRHFSKRGVGHTGFTGTSFWYDPVRDFAVTLLSNRVYPTRNNATFVKKRAIIHDWCWELFA
jgi:CubicO group peptidase (beta-lactamase class C family)